MKKKIDGPRYCFKKGEPGYPDSLLDLKNPPDQLFLLGNPEALKRGISIIGARRATPYGVTCAEMFAKEAALHGLTVVSGGAFGCDSAAHRGALEAGGKTLVVLGGGCDELYPASNRPLFQKIVDAGGALVSENPWSFPAKPYCFRMRNRIIAALSKATLIVEAGLPSGTFSTADEALAISRDVLVVPGSIASSNSAGSNQLLYQGATPVVNRETFEDVLVLLYGCLRFSSAVEEGQGNKSISGKKKGSKEHDTLLEALLASPLRFDEMIALVPETRDVSDKTSWLLLKLSEYEQRGAIKRYPDGTYGAMFN